MGADREIQNLIFRYAELIDAGDYAGIGALFANGRIVVADGSEVTAIEGSAAVQALYESTTRRYSDGTPRTRHVTTNVIIEVDDGASEARARSYFTVLQQVDDLALQPIIAGRYRDTFHAIDETWWFASREMIVDLTGDLSRHLQIDL